MGVEEAKRGIQPEFANTVITVGTLLARDGGSVKTGPFGTALKAEEYSSTGVPLISVGEIGHGYLRIHESTPRAPLEVVERMPQYLLEENDIVFGRKGAVDRSALIRAEQAGWFLGSDGIRLRLPKTCDARFISYQFRSHSARSWLQQHATGTTMASLNQGTIERFPLVLPSLPEQRAIAHILGTLDDKIELNRRMSETLEAMARALFKSWFVDFDPVRAKAEGRDPGLPPHISDLFPNSLVESELGEIPAGWEIPDLGLVCRRVAMGPFGSDIKTDNFVESGVPVVRGGNLAEGFVDQNFVFISDGKADKLRNANAFPGDIVITHRGTLGQVGLIPKESNFPRYVVSQSQLLLTIDSKRATPHYVFEFLRSPLGQASLLANTSQTGVPAIARPTNSVKAIRIVLASLPLLERFDSIAGDLAARRVQARKQAACLIELRDTLLPRLLSGEIRIPDAERLVGLAT